MDRQRVVHNLVKSSALSPSRPSKLFPTPRKGVMIKIRSCDEKYNWRGPTKVQAAGAGGLVVMRCMSSQPITRRRLRLPARQESGGRGAQSARGPRHKGRNSPDRWARTAPSRSSAGHGSTRSTIVHSACSAQSAPSKHSPPIIPPRRAFGDVSCLAPCMACASFAEKKQSVSRSRLELPCGVTVRSSNIRPILFRVLTCRGVPGTPALHGTNACRLDAPDRGLF